jgi:hypothetical protein
MHNERELELLVMDQTTCQETCDIEDTLSAFIISSRLKCLTVRPKLIAE